MSKFSKKKNKFSKTEQITLNQKKVDNPIESAEVKTKKRKFINPLLRTGIDKSRQDRLKRLKRANEDEVLGCKISSF